MTTKDVIDQAKKEMSMELVKYLEYLNLKTALYANRPVEEYDNHPYPEFNKMTDFLSTYTKDLLQSDRETFRNRISNVLSQKYEGVPRIDEKLERAIMYCLSDEYDDTPKSSLSDIIKELNK